MCPATANFIFIFYGQVPHIRSPAIKKSFYSTFLFRTEHFFKIMKVAFIGADVDADLSPGDKVIVSKYAGTDVKLEDGTYSIVRQNDILGVLEEWFLL